MNEREALLILNAIPGLGNTRLLKLLKHFGTAQNVLSAREADLAALEILTPHMIQRLLEFPQAQFLKEELALMQKHQVKMISLFDAEYPTCLREIADAPVLLYVMGQVQALTQTSFGIVGSRRASIYGREMAERFAQQCAEHDLGVVSGLARGIDTAAHQGALKAAGVTVAVLGSGLANIYPAENKKLISLICEYGAVISEFPMTMPPLAYNFPRRNRIVSGLSKGVIVVEAAKKSGALITADFALEQGRDVYAIPGKVDNPYAQGVHHLIQQGAKLITHIEDILEDLPHILPEENKNTSAGNRIAAYDTLSEDEHCVISHVLDKPLHIDEIAQKVASTDSPTVAILMSLELKQLVKQLPGKYFIRN